MTNQNTGISASFGPIRYGCTGMSYLGDPYLFGPYLASNQGYLGTAYIGEPLYMYYDFRCGKLGVQSIRAIDVEQPVSIEALQKIDFEKPTGVQDFQIIDFEHPTGVEVIRFHATATGVSSFISIYNVDKLRILCQFDSRGVTLNNWTVQAGGTASGDFGINNINTDIWEEIYKSTATQLIIDCDTGASSSRPDTFWIGNHNFTSGAVVTIIGSNEPAFSSPLWSVSVTDITPESIFHILEDNVFPLPNIRYVRFLISDPSNTNGYLSFAHILFGSSTIFNGDCITQSITKQIVQFKDEIATEGFTSNMNHRALRKRVSFQFENLKVGQGNYENLVDVFLESRTDLKCLWIPYPLQPARFGVFAKLEEIPVESHNVLGNSAEDLDFVSFDITVDESL